MALFGMKTKSGTSKKGMEKAAEIAADLQKTAVATMKGDYAHVLRAPRITEKASFAMEGSAYVFDVSPDANKKLIGAAVESIYKVRPRKIRVVNTKPKHVRNMRTGKKGTKGGFKKAYVYLKRGESITIA